MKTSPDLLADSPSAVITSVENVNIVSERVLPTPGGLKLQIPLSSAAEQTILSRRREVGAILDRTDKRLLVVVGPCSIHDPKSALEYAGRLSTLAHELSDTFVILMRVYFEKPRTSVGWKGFINDPYLDDSFKIEHGLYQARSLLLSIAEVGLGAATEALDPITPQYLHDLMSWTAIGARTTESQTHREMASGLSTPVGFKNATDGNIQVAINALTSVSQPHRFLGINREGQCTVMETRGNRHGHIVLRGGSRPNYDSVSVLLCERSLKEAKLPVNIMVDCSHGNSLKDPTLQPSVLEDCVNQICAGNRSIIGVMLESNLNAGNQALAPTPDQLRYGVSITDGCIDWDTTAAVLRSARERLAGTLERR